MPEPGGKPFDPVDFNHEVLRAELAQIATQHCYEHGSKVVDDILARYTVTRKPLKELKTA